MANIHCICGNNFSDGVAPNPNGYILLQESDLEIALDRILEIFKSGDDFDAQAPFLISKYGSTSYKCPFCSRLIVFENGTGQPATFYTPGT